MVISVGLVQTQYRTIIIYKKTNFIEFIEFLHLILMSINELNLYTNELLVLGLCITDIVEYKKKKNLEILLINSRLLFIYCFATFLIGKEIDVIKV